MWLYSRRCMWYFCVCILNGLIHYLCTHCQHCAQRSKVFKSRKLMEIIGRFIFHESDYCIGAVVPQFFDIFCLHSCRRLHSSRLPDIYFEHELKRCVKMTKTVKSTQHNNGNPCKSVSFTHTHTLFQKVMSRKTRYVILIGCYDD